MSNERKPRRGRNTHESDHREEDRRVPHSEVLATNTGVRLACTMAAMIGLFGVFLFFVEKESRPIRRFAVQSAVLTAAHGVIAAVLIITGCLLGAIPYFGFLVTLVCWLCYIAALILLIMQRVRLMAHAWCGVRHELPILESLAARYYAVHYDRTEES